MGATTQLLKNTGKNAPFEKKKQPVTRMRNEQDFGSGEDIRKGRMGNESIEGEGDSTIRDNVIGRSRFSTGVRNSDREDHSKGHREDACLRGAKTIDPKAPGTGAKECCLERHLGQKNRGSKVSPAKPPTT